MTVSVQRCVAPNWAALQWRLAREGISLAAAERVVQAMPRLLATTPSTIDARVTLLEARGGDGARRALAPVKPPRRSEWALRHFPYRHTAALTRARARAGRRGPSPE